MKVLDKRVINKRRGDQVADLLEIFVEGKKLTTECRIKIDDTGLGGGVTDQMLRREYKNIYAVNFQEKARHPDKYPNVISEMWFELAPSIVEIACPKDEVLKAELVNRKALPLDKQGRRRVEPKEDYKKRFKGKSPDTADAFLLCFYNPRSQGKVVAYTKGEY